jgi:hypothetical protein
MGLASHGVAFHRDRNRRSLGTNLGTDVMCLKITQYLTISYKNMLAENNSPSTTARRISESRWPISILKCAHDAFQNRSIIKGLQKFDLLDDPAMDRVWLTIDEKYRFRPTKDFFWTVVGNEARLNSFHPVCDYLDGLTWDGTKRLDTWLVEYAGAANTEYVRAVSPLPLIAAVRRVRKPGCKFDEMLTLISDQGFDKSTGLAILAVNPDWFCSRSHAHRPGRQRVGPLRYMGPSRPAPLPERPTEGQN